jgi:carbon monoxide dehydrogenase subunit G
MRKMIAAFGVLILVSAAYLAYRYWQIQSLAKKYATATEIASASIEKSGPTWTIHIESVIADPIDAVWKALRQPERSAELLPTTFKRSTLLKEEGAKKTLELEVTLLSLPSQSMVAELTYDDADHVVKIDTHKGLQDIHGSYQLTALAPDKTLLVFDGKAVDNVSLPVPQSVVEGALRELFVMQVRAVKAAIHGKPAGGAATGGAATAASEVPKPCVGPPAPGSAKQVTVAVARAAAGESQPASEPAEFRRDLPQGYDRGYVVEGVPIRESYRVDTACTTATATVGALTLQVQSVLLSPDGLESWVKQVDLKALGTAAAAGATQIDQRTLLATFPRPPRGWQIVPPATGSTLPGALVFQVYEQALF